MQQTYMYKLMTYIYLRQSVQYRKLLQITALCILKADKKAHRTYAATIDTFTITQN